MYGPDKGSMHDVTQVRKYAEAYAEILGLNEGVIYDRGYPGVSRDHPLDVVGIHEVQSKKPPGGQLTADQQRRNRKYA